jgi:hypothetical protein
MSVVNAKNDAFHYDWLGRHFGVCSLCEKALGPPFLWWQTDQHIKICGKCCQRMRDARMAPMFKAEGFALDLLQVAATADIQELERFKGTCFTRSTVRAEEEAGIRETAKTVAINRLYANRADDKAYRAGGKAGIDALDRQVDALAENLAQKAIARL